MNLSKTQKILLALTGLNLAIVFLFPPFDDHSVTNNGAAIFAGFLFVFNSPHNFIINSSLLYLEVMVVLINLCILWLLTTQNARRQDKKKINFRKAAMGLIGFNLIGVLLFPPFEYISNMTHAIIPTFEGFYFIFSHPPYRVIVTPILYLEVFFILINGGLILLAFKEDNSEKMTAEQAMVHMAKLQAEKAKALPDKAAPATKTVPKTVSKKAAPKKSASSPKAATKTKTARTKTVKKTSAA
jgi:hypothetical protein